MALLLATRHLAGVADAVFQQVVVDVIKIELDRRSQGEKLGQGRDNAVDFLRANPKLANELESAIRSQYTEQEAEAAKAAAPKAAPAKVPTAAKK